MFRIIVRPQFYIDPKSQPANNYVVCKKVSDNELLIKHMSRNGECYDEKTLISDIAYNTKHHIVVEGKNKFSPIIDNDALESGRVNSICLYSQDSFVVSENSPVIPYSIQMYKNQTEDVCIVYFGIPTLFIDCDPEEFNYLGKFREYLLDNYPEYHLKREMMSKKRQLLVDLDPNNSLSYMEAQLDFVTKMLFAVLEKEPSLKAHALEAVKEYTNVKSAFETSNVFTVKDEHKSYLDLAEGKKQVREKQAAFLKDKASLLDGE